MTETGKALACFASASLRALTVTDVSVDSQRPTTRSFMTTQSILVNAVDHRHRSRSASAQSITVTEFDRRGVVRRAQIAGPRRAPSQGRGRRELPCGGPPPVQAGGPGFEAAAAAAASGANRSHIGYVRDCAVCRRRADSVRRVGSLWRTEEGADDAEGCCGEDVDGLAGRVLTRSEVEAAMAAATCFAAFSARSAASMARTAPSKL